MSITENISKQKKLEMYDAMYRIRVFEDNANELYLSAKMPGLTHMYSGQEAVAVGICATLDSKDYITSTHRGHGHCLAKGASFKEMFCELLGKAEGYCKGKGGSMHIADQLNGNLGANAIVGGSVGIATGAALSSKYLKNKRATVCFFGDGALGQGILYEVMNMASLWSLPVIYACENNLYGEYTKTQEMLAGKILKRPESFSIKSYEVDGQDIEAVYHLSKSLTTKVKKGEGPFFILLNTYRYHGHHVGDVDRSYYRSKEEEIYWKTERDPIQLYEKKLLDDAVVSKSEIHKRQADIKKEAEAAVEYAINASYPDVSEVNQHIFSV